MSGTENSFKKNEKGIKNQMLQISRGDGRPGMLEFTSFCLYIPSLLFFPVPSLNDNGNLL